MRVKTGYTRRRKHQKVLKKAKGMRGTRHRSVRKAKEALMHAGQDAYIGRRNRKRDLRRLWITRLNAAVREEGIGYSQFIHLLKDKRVELDRKILSQLAITDPKTFSKIIEAVKA